MTDWLPPWIKFRLFKRGKSSHSTLRSRKVLMYWEDGRGWDHQEAKLKQKKNIKWLSWDSHETVTCFPTGQVFFTDKEGAKKNVSRSKIRNVKVNFQRSKLLRSIFKSLIQCNWDIKSGPFVKIIISRQKQTDTGFLSWILKFEILTADIDILDDI